MVVFAEVWAKHRLARNIVSGVVLERGSPAREEEACSAPYHMLTCLNAKTI